MKKACSGRASFSTGKLSVEEYVGTPKDDGFLSPLYKGVVEATEEAILNALFMSETVTGYKGHTRHALPLDQTLSVLDWYNSEK